MKKIFYLITVSFFVSLITSFTIRSNDSYTLFYIGRSKDKNIIKYDINLTIEGKINVEKPLKIYWVKYTNNNKIEGLSYIQNKLAYGVEYLNSTSEEVKFKFVSYDKRIFVIKKNIDGKYFVYTYLKEKNVQVKKIHIQIDGGTFMIPKISYVQLYWRDKNKDDVEVIIP